MTVAIRWAERGMAAFPVAVSWDEKKQGTNKRPLTPHGHHDGSIDPLQVKDLFVQYGGRLRDGEELAAGMSPGDYLVADCDRHGTGDGPAYADSIGLNGTWTVSTASGGEHRFYRKPAGATYSNTIPDTWRGLIDVRADAGWIVCPGCSTTWGSWTPRTPWDPTQVADLPPHIMNLLRPTTPTGGGAWHTYQPERDNPTLHPLTIETHTLLVQHHGVDPQQTTVQQRTDTDTGEVIAYLHVTRPGKHAGTSGTIGYIAPGVLYLFTDNWPHLPAHKPIPPHQLLPPDTTDDTSNQYGWITWSDLWANTTDEREELIPGIWTCGAAGSIYSPAGAGKSLLGLEWATSLALGLPILGQPTTPHTVVYLDLENDEQLIRERLEDLDLAHRDIPNLHYSLLGDWRPLDTEQGGLDLLAEAARVNADIVFIDTTSRVISGEENSADTFLNLYRHTIRPLKAAGIATLRFDHSGKDLAKGERGSSAKRSDVDLTYRLKLEDEHTVTLKREKNRLHLPGPELLTLTRDSDPLRHTPLPPDRATDDRIAALVAELHRLNAPTNISKRPAGRLLRDHGKRHSTGDLIEALRRYRAHGFADHPRTTPTTSGPTEPADHSRTKADHPRTARTSTEGSGPSAPPPYKGRARTTPAPTCDTCGKPLLLIKPGRTRCAACDKKATP